MNAKYLPLYAQDVLLLVIMFNMQDVEIVDLHACTVKNDCTPTTNPEICSIVLNFGRYVYWLFLSCMYGYQLILLLKFRIIMIFSLY